ncbi:MAG: ATP-binding protein [Candidatus Eisenbacteria bacterium]|uniref:histidine kinase n=1 Tax=Eiseniibacteriota bacterium TaxID=2212470 RepID=A0A849SM35_UNCEI|nr:ATP-binding protein [Candidatus Eisenbacteria bacterium]
MQALVRAGSEVHRTLYELLAIPTRELEQRLTAIHEHAYAEALERSSRVRVVISVVAILLLASAALTMIELQRTSHKVRELNATLEQRVSDRTQALDAVNHQLRVEMEERERVDEQLRQSQKLEAVGRLAAGVAHEINTPIQFVGDSVHFLRSATEDLTGLIRRYQVVTKGFEPAGADPPGMSEVRACEDEIDLEDLLEQVPRAVDRSQEGLGRVAEIVRSMKQFAHPDHSHPSSVDLNRSLKSTLVVSHGEYKFVADVVTEFGELPLVSCYVGELNQVFLNIIVNAAHAIGDVVGSTGARGRITVRTRIDGDEVVVEFSDTGGGIPPAVAARIFDPFFTTKAVGRGTGQGLAIARSIVVSKHGGDISFETEPGIGITFSIRLPLLCAEELPARAA